MSQIRYNGARVKYEKLMVIPPYQPMRMVMGDGALYYFVRKEPMAEFRIDIWIGDFVYDGSVRLVDGVVVYYPSVLEAIVPNPKVLRIDSLIETNLIGEAVGKVYVSTAREGREMVKFAIADSSANPVKITLQNGTDVFMNTRGEIFDDKGIIYTLTDIASWAEPKWMPLKGQWYKATYGGGKIVLFRCLSDLKFPAKIMNVCGDIMFVGADGTAMASRLVKEQKLNFVGGVETISTVVSCEGAVVDFWSEIVPIACHNRIAGATYAVTTTKTTGHITFIGRENTPDLIVTPTMIRYVRDGQSSICFLESDNGICRAEEKKTIHIDAAKNIIGITTYYVPMTELPIEYITSEVFQ